MLGQSIWVGCGLSGVDVELLCGAATDSFPAERGLHFGELQHTAEPKLAPGTHVGYVSTTIPVDQRVDRSRAVRRSYLASALTLHIRSGILWAVGILAQFSPCYCSPHPCSLAQRLEGKGGRADIKEPHRTLLLPQFPAAAVLTGRGWQVAGGGGDTGAASLKHHSYTPEPWI